MGRRNSRGKGKKITTMNGVRLNKNTPDGCTIRGHEIFSTITANSSTSTAFGTNGSLLLNLISLSDRLATIGKVYERFKYIELIFSYIPLVSTAQAGSLTIGIDDDVVTTENSGGNSNYLTTASLRNSFQTQLYEKAAVRWRPVDPKKMYYCDTVTNSGNVATNRFVSPCSIFGYFNTPNLSTTTIGVLRVDYIVRFEGAIAPSTITKSGQAFPSRYEFK